MKKPGPKSAASLSVITNAKVIKRPKAPVDLTSEMKQEWGEVVNRLPSDWFTRETHSILTQYCRHVIAARRVSQLIEQVENAENWDVDYYDKLLKMQERESRTITSIATRMRITQQSKYTAKSANTASNNSESDIKPWEM